jgi:Leucine-rich repeat (LRR) protein
MNLPDSLVRLQCRKNKIAHISNIPINMTYFNCYSNQIKSLPTIQNNLIEIYCGKNLMDIDELKQTYPNIKIYSLI